MEKMISLLPMPLVILELFIASSQAVLCHWCDSRRLTTDDCNIPFKKGMTDCNDHVCKMRRWEEDGRFMIYFLSFTVTFTSTYIIQQQQQYLFCQMRYKIANTKKRIQRQAARRAYAHQCWPPILITN